MASRAHAQTRRIEVYRPFPWDWLIAVPLLISGLVGVVLFTDSALWDEVVNDGNALKSVAVIEPLGGQLRFRGASSSVWQDVTGRKPARNGDSVHTGPDGRARVVLEDGNRIEMAPDTMIVVQLERRAKRETSDGWSRLAALIERKVERTDPPDAPVLEVKSGTVSLAPVSGEGKRRDVSLKVAGMTYRLQAAPEKQGAAASAVDVSVKPALMGEPSIRFAAANPSAVKIAVAGGPRTAAPNSPVTPVVEKAAPVPARALENQKVRPLAVPTTIVPGPDARFAVDHDSRSHRISFRWEGSAPGDEVEMEIYRRGGTKPVRSLRAGRYGGELELEPGDYSWWVRSVRGAERSDWSPHSVFRITRRNPPPPKVETAAKVPPAAPPAAAMKPDPIPGTRPVPAPAVQMPVVQRPAVARAESGPSAVRLSARPAARPVRRVRKAAVQVSPSAMSEKEKAARVEELLKKKARLYAQARKEIAAKKAGKVIAGGLLSVPPPSRMPSAAPSAHRIAAVTSRNPAPRIQIGDATVAAIRGTETRMENGASKAVSQLFSGEAAGTAADTRIKDSENFRLDRLDVRLAWGAVQGAVAYEVAVYRGGVAFVEQEVREPSYLLVVDSLSSDYDYRISARMADGSRITSDLTPVRISLSPPIPKLPLDGDVRTENASVLMTWERTVLTESYRFQISRSRDFNDLLADESVEGNYFHFSPPAAGAYYWRLKGIAGRSESEWSPVQHFTQAK